MSDELNPPIAATWSRTCSNTINFSHKWTIDNFSFHCVKQDKREKVCMTSSPFSSVANNEIKWRLKLFPSRTSGDKDYVGIFLELFTTGIPKLVAKFEFYLIDVNNMKKYSKKISHAFQKDLMDWGYSTYIEKELLLEQANDLLPDDKLTIFCEIVIAKDIVTISGERQPIHDEILISRLNDDFKQLLKFHDFSDVTLTVSGKDIPAHKLVLAARSPVFAAMFKHNMEEQKSNSVKIDDIDYEIFMEMLEFIYTDKAPNIKKMATNLIGAAEKYNLEGLKALCVEALYDSLKIENAVDILVLSYLYNADRLKTVVTDFICEFTKDVMNTEAFESIPHTYPDLMVEILRAIRTKKNSSENFPVDGECSKSSE